MIDRSFVEKIEEMSKPEIMVVGDKTYSNKALSLIQPPFREIATLEVHTLTAILDFLKNGIDQELPGLMLHIINYDRVELITELDQIHKRRSVLVRAVYEPIEFTFNKFYDAEMFIIKLQTCFVESELKRKLLSIAGNIKEEDVRMTNDDGITQTVIARQTIAKVAEVDVPPTWLLIPYRTFLDVDQIESPYIVRMKRGPEFALFEADGGMWKIKAIEQMKLWFDKQFKSLSIQLPIIA